MMKLELSTVRNTLETADPGDDVETCVKIGRRNWWSRGP